MSIYLTAIIKAKRLQHQALKDVLLNMVVQSRQEEACIQYDLQEELNQAIFIFHEEWASQDGLDAHNQKPYILDFVSKANELTEEVIIYKTQKIEP